MNQPDKRSRHDDDERSTAQQPPPYTSHSPHSVGLDTPGKTSFLRLLLDTSSISPTATKEQLANVAKFVQGCNGHTSYIRPTSIDINVDIEGNRKPQSIGLHLVDTPSLDFKDEKAAEWSLSEILRNVDGRFAEGVEMDWNAQKTDRYVHLCIYFLDPDQIVPPPVPGPSAPLVPRARTNSFSHTEQEPVILEPPLTTNPLLLRPTLPAAEIETIRRLSARVNVLPVIARADILSNERLAAVKVAIRRDLAEAGIGFGIFDMDTTSSPLYQQQMQDDHPPPKNTEASNGYGPNHSGSVPSNGNTPPTSPITPAHLRLPYALISPDMYSHSDGVARPPPSRAELVYQYTPSPYAQTFGFNLIRGKFIRSYRWGTLDVLDPTHSDFLALRAAIFHHMDTLQKYTREYLFDKFRIEYHRQQRPSSHLSVPNHHTQGMSHMGSLSHGTRPILAIDTAPHQAIHRHPPLSGPRDILSGEIRPGQRPMAEPMAGNGSARGSSRSTKQRTKKITVACNFCRSRKLKCDGGRPACSQCVKRSHPCDYMPQNKRRGTIRQRKDDESESDSGEDRSADADEVSASPEIPSQPLSRRSSNVDKLSREGFAPLPQIAVTLDRRERDEGPLPGPSTLRTKPPHINEGRSLFPDNELPAIATLSLPEPSPSTPVPMSAPTLLPLRPASEQQAAQRKRAATVPGKIPRTAANSGPKVVASRKTKCDGAHPACASCARRSLPCNYIHDSSGPSGLGQKKGRRASSSKPPPVDSPHSLSPPSSRMAPTPSTANDPYDLREDSHTKSEYELKRLLDYPEPIRPPKKMRMEGSAAAEYLHHALPTVFFLPQSSSGILEPKKEPDTPRIRTSPSLPELNSQGIPWPEDLVDVAAIQQVPAADQPQQGAAKSSFQGVPYPIPFHKPFRPSSGKPKDGPISSLYMSSAPSAFDNRKSAVPTIGRYSQRRARVSPTFNLMVAGGKGTGKTSLLRLLLDTADISPTATIDQRTALDRFLRGSVKSTQSIETACIEICESRFDRVLLSVIDTPGLDYSEGKELKLERQVNSVIKYVDAQYADTMNEESKVVRKNRGDQHIHVCLYLIDPKSILSAAERHASSGLPTKTRSETTVSPPDLVPDTSSGSDSDGEGDVSLTMSPAEIRVIHRLSTRANILPVVGHADSLTDEKLQAVKLAVRKGLAEAGIDLGVFDARKPTPAAAQTPKRQTHFAAPNGNGHDAQTDDAPAEQVANVEVDEERQARPVIKLRSPRHANGRTLSRSRSRRDLSVAADDERRPVSPDATDVDSVANVRFSAHLVAKTEIAEQLPFAFIAPEGSKRRQRPTPSESPMLVSPVSPMSPEEEVPQTPSSAHNAKSHFIYSPPEDLKGVFTRKFRWGAVDVLDPSHCDFAALRTAALSTHLKLLKTHTNEVLYERYRTEKLLARRATRNISEDERQRLLEDLGL
ncbi:hypothetical protein H0H87_007300 [Tephrocybe sp. NHM501043]|nr:hypothetical protein H0H87_007300 [Tephrocybe sp. NHM501043]